MCDYIHVTHLIYVFRLAVKVYLQYVLQENTTFYFKISHLNGCFLEIACKFHKLL